MSNSGILILFDSSGEVISLSNAAQDFFLRVFDKKISSGTLLQDLRIEELTEVFKNATSGLVQKFLWSSPSVFKAEITFTPLFQGQSIVAICLSAQELPPPSALTDEIRKLSLVATNTPNAVMICDGEGNIEWVNQGFVTLTGFTVDEVLGKDPFEILYNKRAEQQTREKIITKLREGKVINETFLNYSKQGTPYWIQLIVSPVYNQEGLLVNYVAIGTNTSDKMVLLQQAQERNQLLTSITVAAPLVLYIFNLTTMQVEFINEHVFNLTGYHVEEIIQMSRNNQLKLTNSADDEIIRQSFFNLLQIKEHATQTCQLTIIHKTAEPKIINATHTIFRRNFAGEPTHILGSLIDITEQHKSEKYRESVARLKELQYRKNQKSRSLMLLQGQEEERKRLARELHDGIGQLLTATSMKINNMEGIAVDSVEYKELFASVKQLVLKTIHEVRAVSYALVPIDLFDFGLDAALAQLCDLAKKSGMSCSFQSNLNGKRIYGTIEIEFYRVAQEAINNSIKYSGARSLDVRLSVSEITDVIKLMIIDDGIGFDYDPDYIYKKNTKRSFGLRNMSERSRIINGKLTIISEKGQGCIIILESPLKLSEV